MAAIGKILNHLTLRCIYAVCIGVAVVTAFVALLSLYGADPASNRHGADSALNVHGAGPAVHAAVKSMAFPENEAMLDAVADQLAREGAALSGIEPAAGK